MNLLDIIILGVAAFMLIRGCFRGLVREVASIVGLVLAFYLANSYHNQITPLVARYVVYEYAQAISYLLVFLGVMLGAFLVSTIVRRFLRLIMLGWLDTLGGGILGGAKGLLFGCVLILALTTFLPQNSPIVASSKLAPHLTHLNKQISALLPQEMKEQFKEKSKSLAEFWKGEWAENLKDTDRQ
ncbi:MAG: CvpA family protein [Deltaproteobacteria bacterium]|nr:CvpA family protein [Deltaproteobacteria bacterium]